MNSKIRKDRIRNDDTRDNREVTPIGENEKKTAQDGCSSRRWEQPS